MKTLFQLIMAPFAVLIAIPLILLWAVILRAFDAFSPSQEHLQQRYTKWNR